jgi:hypothetical protein
MGRRGQLRDDAVGAGAVEMSRLAITEAEVRKKFESFIRDHFGTAKDFAAAQKCSPAYVSQAITGARKFPAKWLPFIGVSRLVEVTYYADARP